MTKVERNWCLGYAMILAVLTTLPYLLAFQTQGDSWRFTGFVFAVEDGNSYIAKMLLGAGGAWLFRTPYTADPQRGVLAYLPYLLLGKLAAGEGVHEQLVALFHLFRVLAIPAAVLATYRFASAFVTQTAWRRWATFLATAGGGMGWLLVALGKEDWLGSMPLDFYSPETFGFLSIFGLPHLVLGRALLLNGVVSLLESVQAGTTGWRPGILWLVLGLVHPLEMVSAYAVAAATVAAIGFALWRRGERAAIPRAARPVAQAMLISSPVVVYSAIAFTLDPYLRAWTSQNQIPSPHPLHYVAAFGLMLVPMAAGVMALSRERRLAGLLPIAWVAVLPLLAYAPSPVQRRLPEGVWVAVITLAAAGLSRWAPMASRARWAGNILLALSLPTTALLLVGGIRTASQPAEPAFVPAAQVEAFDRLAERAVPGSIALASYPTSNALPAWAPLRVVIGHGPESARLSVLEPAVDAFYSLLSTDPERQAFLAEHRVRYVLYGPQERRLGDWDPAAATYLEPVHVQAGYAVYIVKSD